MWSHVCIIISLALWTSLGFFADKLKKMCVCVCRWRLHAEGDRSSRSWPFSMSATASGARETPCRHRLHQTRQPLTTLWFCSMAEGRSRQSPLTSDVTQKNVDSTPSFNHFPARHDRRHDGRQFLTAWPRRLLMIYLLMNHRREGVEWSFFLPLTNGAVIHRHTRPEAFFLGHPFCIQAMFSPANH